MPLSADLTLPETSGVPCVSVPTLTGVGEDTGSRKLGPCPRVLKGVSTMVSSCLRKEGCTKDPRVAKEMGLGVGPRGGVGNSVICSTICSSGPICTTSIRVGGIGVRMSRDALSSSSNSLTTSPTIDSTNTSLIAWKSLLCEFWVSTTVPVLLGLPSLGSARKVRVDPVLLGSRSYHPSPNLSR